MKRLRTFKWVFIIALLLLVVLNASPLFITVDTAAISNLNGGKIEVVGHAGSGFTSLVNPWNPYPENSAASFRQAMLNGADGLEMDVQMSADSVFFLYHDERLDSKTNGSGCIGNLAAAEITGTHYALGMPYDWFGRHSVLALQDFMTNPYLDKAQHSVHLDLKPHNYCDAEKDHAVLLVFARSLVRQLNELQVNKKKTFLICTYVTVLEEIKRLDPDLIVVIEETSDFEKGLKASLENHYKYLAVKASLLTHERVATAHANGIKIITFGGKSRLGAKQLIELNPDIIDGDNVPVMHDLLDY